MSPQAEQGWKDELEKLSDMVRYWDALRTNPKNPYSPEYTQARYQAAVVAWHAVAQAAEKREVLILQ